MKIYKISQTVDNGYDTYDGAIVAAETEEEARRISPDNWYVVNENDMFVRKSSLLYPKEYISSWCKVEDVKVEYIGEAKEGIEKGVILSSFNAG